MNAMRYHGYSARVEFDAEDRIFVGHIAGVQDIVGFRGASVDELEAAFHEAIDDYLAACKKLEQAPLPQRDAAPDVAGVRDEHQAPG